MEKCKWSFFKFNHYYQYTEKKVFQIIGKNKEEQWAVKFRVSFNCLQWLRVNVSCEFKNENYDNSRIKTKTELTNTK